MMEAFSKAREYCEVGLWVKASNLGKTVSAIRQVFPHTESPSTRHAPCKANLDVLLVHREAQVEQLQLSIVSVEKVPPGGAVLARTSHVLPEAVEGGAFLGVPLWIVAIGVLDVVFEGMYPVDLVGGLERHGDHGNLGHVSAAC